MSKEEDRWAIFSPALDEPRDQCIRQIFARIKSWRLEQFLSCLQRQIFFRQLEWDELKCNGYGSLQELLWNLHRSGATIRGIAYTLCRSAPVVNPRFHGTMLTEHYIPFIGLPFAAAVKRVEYLKDSRNEPKCN
jgi:hypothetical protein